MSTIATPPAEVPVIPAAPPVESTTPVDGTEGQESSTEDPATPVDPPAEPTEPSEPTGEETATTTTEEEDPFLADSTLPAEQLTKIKAAFGDGALEIVAKLEQTQALEQAFGEIPSVEFVQSLAQGQQAIAQLFADLNTNPDKALAYFLQDEKGELDAKGAQFMGALADGLRRGSLPVESRMQLAQAAFASALVDVETNIQALNGEIKYAEGQGWASKVNDFQLQVGEQEIIKDFLNKFLGVKLPSRRPMSSQDPERIKLEADKAAFEKQKQAESNQRLAGVENQQIAKYQSIVDQEISKFTSQIPATIAGSLKEAAIQGAMSKLHAAAESSDRQKLFEKHHKNALALAASGKPEAQEAFNKAANAYRNMMQIVASQVYGPILKDLGVVVSDKSKATLDARKAGEAKTGAPPVASTSAQVSAPTDWNWDRSKETKDQYLERMTKISSTR